MRQNSSSFTVFFEDPFWVGVYERVTDGKLEACKITFGAEPKDYEVHAFLQENWHRLRFSPPVAAGTRPATSPNPKRMQRAIHKQLAAHGVGTKAQQAIQQQREENKTLRTEKSRAQRESEKQLQFEQRQQKKKEKHKGH